MKQYEAVIEVMKNKGGYATSGELYREVFKLEGVKWPSQTPFASIRRIVQDERFFLKIKPGLWALKTHKQQMLKLFEIEKKQSPEERDFSHTYYQGLLVEIGNLKKISNLCSPTRQKSQIL